MNYPMLRNLPIVSVQLSLERRRSESVEDVWTRSFLAPYMGPTHRGTGRRIDVRACNAHRVQTFLIPLNPHTTLHR